MAMRCHGNQRVLSVAASAMRRRLEMGMNSQDKIAEAITR
jgi:hypothetical protein